MKVAIFGISFKKSFHQQIKDIFDKLAFYNISIVIYKPFFEYIRSNLSSSFEVSEFFTCHEDFQDDIDLVISIGGDGTFLDSILIIQDLAIPIIGINSGHLGFLANISKDEISEAIDSIINNKYTLDLRTLIKLETEENKFGKLNFALNEITIHKQGTAMLTIHTYINNELMNTYIADGLIIATPTGSTAYSLSVGGPVVIPNCGNFIISPIAPHNLSVRPIIIPDCFEIRIDVCGRDEQFMVSMDHQHKLFNMSTQLILSKTDFKIKMIKLQSNSFYNTLRNKLMWGIDKRNNIK